MRFIHFLTSLVLFLVAGTTCLCAEGQDRQTVKIGLVFPLTGPMASFGEDVAKAIPLLEKKFNSAQTQYHFKLLLEDGQFGQSNAAIAAAKKLVAVDKVQFLVVGSSGEALQIAPFVEAEGILTVAGFASHPDIKNAGDYIFRTYIDAERGIRLVADDMLIKGLERIAIISEESSFTLAIKESLQRFLGSRVVLSEDFAFADSDFRTLIAKARSKAPQAYYLNTATPINFIALFKRLRENGVHEPFYAYYTPSMRDVQKSLGSKLDGTIYLDYPDAAETSEDFNIFLAEFEKQHVVKAPFNFRTNYNAIKVLFDGVVAVGPESSKVKNFLYTYDQPSAAGRLRFDSNGDAKDLELVLKTYKSAVSEVD